MSKAFKNAFIWMGFSNEEIEMKNEKIPSKTKLKELFTEHACLSNEVIKNRPSFCTIGTLQQQITNHQQ